ncbi:MAG: cytochrome c oxidase subunit II [Rhodospirillaceae bacterium]|nr:MAG: cytochrome c oxidase subunit II [Rhodospirillaceae bacterium]
MRIVGGGGGILLGVLAPGVVWAGQPLPWQIGLQPAASPVMEDVVALHGYVLIVIIGVACLVMGLLGFVIWRFNARRNPTPATWCHHTLLEIVWTVVPVLILTAIAVPSFRLLYRQDHIPPADLTLKVEGHQWYWSYAYPDLGISFDANMVETDQLQAGEPRLLTADAPVVVPVGQVVRVQLTADDVLHSWAVPALGVRTDTVPGRLNESWFQVKEPGLYYGFCAELCGVRHAYMPIVVRAVPEEAFKAWVQERKVAQNPSPQHGNPPLFEISALDPESDPSLMEDCHRVKGEKPFGPPEANDGCVYFPPPYVLPPAEAPRMMPGG